MKWYTFLIICYLHSLIVVEASYSSHDNENHVNNAISVTANGGFYRLIDNLPDENNSHHFPHHSLQAGHSHQKHGGCCGKDTQKMTLHGLLKHKNMKKISVATSINTLKVSQFLTETNNSSDYHPALSIKRLPLHILNMAFLI
ncbi:hypothetical protein ACFL5S_01305 [Fibrobacterota bacterium]